MKEEQKNETKVQKPTNFGIYILAGFGAIALISLVVWPIFSFVQSARYSENLDMPSLVQSETESIPEENQEEFEENIAEGLFTKFIKTKSGLKDFSPSLNDEEIVVEWYKGAKMVDSEKADAMLYDKYPELKKLSQKDDPECVGDYGGFCTVLLFEVGEVQSPSIIEGESLFLFLTFFSEMGSGYVEHYVVYDSESEKFVYVISEHTTDSYTNQRPYTHGGSSGLAEIFDGFVGQDFDELEGPDRLSIPDQNSHLIKKGFLSEGSLFEITGTYNNKGGILNAIQNKIAKPYGEDSISFYDPKYGSVYFVDSSFRIFMMDGSVKEYDLIPSFVHEPEGEDKEMYRMAYDVSIEWNNDYTDNYGDQYRLGGEITTEGCGAGIRLLDNIANKKEWFDAGKLVEIGRTASDGFVYELADKETNLYYKDFFDYGYASYTYFKLSEDERKDGLKTEFTDEDYKNFLNDSPIFFWKDHLGNWRYYLKSKYETLSECGKPVIYLYPEQQMDVRVEVAPNGGFTKTEPLYPEGGWVVNAKPNGELYYYAERKNYPYLFWEGKGYDFSIPEDGFVFAREDVPREMRILLRSTGLNETETEDFMEFWEEKLMRDEYVFVTFASQREFDRGAPLTIHPNPDTVLRVFMYYEPLQNYKKVYPLYFRAPERRGFTVVEWGGALPASEIK